jgi:N-methylhydantoinase B
VFEYRFPWHVGEFRLVDDSGGPGAFRGGLALTKTVRSSAEMTFSYMSDRQKLAPWGLHGGLPGAKAELLFQRDGAGDWLTITQAFNKVSPSKFANVPIHPGDRIRIASPAGGGWGPPGERDPERLAEDVREGYVSAVQAATLYAPAE